MKRSENRLAIIGLSIAVLVIVGYYVLHKPITSDGFLALTRIFFHLFASCSMILVAAAIGQKVTPSELTHGGQRFTLHLAFGLGVLSLVWLLLATSGFLKPVVGWLVLLGLALINLKGLRSVVHDLSVLVRSVLPADRFEYLVAGLTCWLALVPLLEALAPPVAFDALVYHLELPQEFIASGALVFAENNPFWGQPLAGELVYTWAMLLGTASTATVFGWFVAAGAVLGTISTARNIAPGAGWVAGAALLSGKTLSQGMGWGYVDWWTALFGIAIVALLISNPRHFTRTKMVGLGVLAGLALGTKLTAGVIIISVLAVTISHNRREALTSSTIFLACVALLFLPWLLKNTVATGMPLYPFFGGQDSLLLFRQSLYHQMPSQSALWAAPLVPFVSTLLGVEGAPGYAASIGPLLAAFTMLALMPQVRKQPRVRSLLVFFAAGSLTWGLASLSSVLLSQPRLYLVIFPAWAVLAGAGFAGISAIAVGQVRFRRIGIALVLLVLTLSSLQALNHLVSSRIPSYLLGQRDRDAYLVDRLGGYYVAAQTAVERVSSGSVLMLWEPRGFYCDQVCVPDPWLDRWRVELRHHRDPASIIDAWNNEGHEYILIHRNGVEFVQEHEPGYSQGDWDVLELTLSELELVERIGSGYELYRMADS